MGFFKEFKDDLSQAVNELLPEEKIEGVTQDSILESNVQDDDITDEAMDIYDDDDDNVDRDILDAILTPVESLDEDENEDALEVDIISEAIVTDVKVIRSMETNKSNSAASDIKDESTVITKGTTITGNISSDGSLEIMGTIKGDIECQGKLSILGFVTGNCMASEIYIGSKRLVGCISSEGSVKIGLGTVIIGDVTASSAVIAGAIKGEIDINGPVIIDSSAVIKGNIKAQSIQINNGAVIEGFCSLSYASIDIDNIFE